MMMMNGDNNGNETNGKQPSMSPLVTAQDRKRKIRERRRKEREQQQQQQQAEENTNAALANTAAASRSNLALKRKRNDASRILNDENLTPKTSGGSSTLFGAVMQRTSSGSTTSASTPKKKQQRAASARTPNNGTAWKHVTTPSSTSRSKSFLSANSPCGFALLKVLESVASPFRHNEDEEDGDDEESHAVDTRIEEWQEASLEQDSIGIIDWSMKRKVRLECHPGSCLPSTSDWQDALLFWQHPAMHPLPSSLMDSHDGTNVSQSTREVSATMHPSLSLSEMVRGRNALLHRLVRQDETVWRQARNREWQQAFSCLFKKWIKQVETLQNTLETGDDSVTPQDVSQTYFYAMAPGQTILFRIGMDENRLVPMVVLSSTTHTMRSKIQSMGAKLLYYHDQRTEFQEQVLEKKKPPPTKSTEEQEENVHEELEALRRAQAHGETAGADVSIAQKTKSSTSTRSPRSIPPLCLVGKDDCWAFFEFYLNTMGHDTTWLKGMGDVPLLLSRKVGPFLHASLKSLQVTSRREANHASSQQQKQEDHHAAIELRGTILPCALQELICTAASRMLHDTASPSSSSQGDNEDDVGSHYFVIQSQAHEGQERPNVDSGTTGTASSRWLNNGSDLYTALATNNNDDAPNECEYGEVASMIVWDIERPSMVAYKTEKK